MYVDTTGVEDLYTVTVENPVILGANVSLSRCIQVFEEAAREFAGHRHLQQIANHWKYVANVGVRNVSCNFEFHDFYYLISLFLIRLEAGLEISC